MSEQIEPHNCYNHIIIRGGGELKIDSHCRCSVCDEYIPTHVLKHQQLQEKLTSLQNSIIAACERVMNETNHKPINASEMADIIIQQSKKIHELESDVAGLGSAYDAAQALVDILSEEN